MPRPKKPSRVMILGLDAPITPRLYAYARAGKLPHLAKLMDEGVYGVNCLVPFPTITPPGWTSIVTGAWPGTHGITGYNQHKPGTALDSSYPGFDSQDCQAEYLWTAAERAGKKSIVLNYPSSWPPTMKEGIHVGGAGLSADGWRTDSPRGTCLAGDQVFATEYFPLGTEVEAEDAEDWDNLPESQDDPLEFALPMRYNGPVRPVQPKTWYALVTDSQGDGYDTVHLSETRDAATSFAKLHVGEWTANLRQTFTTTRGEEEAIFRCKLIELSADAQEFKLYISPLSKVEIEQCQPRETAAELNGIATEGLPGNRAGYAAYGMEWIDLDTLVELVEFQHVWLADAASHLMRNHEWNLFFMHDHAPDWMYHTFSTQMDPATSPSPEVADRHGQAELRIYQAIDNMVGAMVDCADRETLVVLTSDHGAKANTNDFRPHWPLEKAGLLVYKQDDDGEQVVDWSQTKAIPQRTCYVYVNVKGRDPEGIVELGEEYERVCDEVIKALYDYTDPGTGLKAVSLALKRRDARVLGLYGEMIGDIVYALDGRVGEQHGPFLPTSEWGVGSQKGLFIMCGPGVNRGQVLERTIDIVDIVPTICYLADLPIPAQAEGGIVYQALRNPNRHLSEIARLQRSFDRLQRAFEGIQAETHKYNE